MLRGGAGNSRGLSGGAGAQSVAPPSTSPRRAGASSPARAGLPELGQRGSVSARSPGAGGGRGAGRHCCSSRAAPRAGRPCAPAPGPPPPRGLRLLLSHTPRAARAPGLPGAPPPLHSCPRPGFSSRQPALLPPGRVLVLKLSFHTHAAGPVPLLGPSPFSCPS